MRYLMCIYIGILALYSAIVNQHIYKIASVFFFFCTYSAVCNCLVWCHKRYDSWRLEHETHCLEAGKTLRAKLLFSFRWCKLACTPSRRWSEVWERSWRWGWSRCGDIVKRLWYANCFRKWFYFFLDFTRANGFETKNCES